MWEDDYRAAVRAFMAANGQPVQVKDPTAYDDLYEVPRWASEAAVSPYGYWDRDLTAHAGTVRPWQAPAPCSWVVAEGAGIHEVSYSEFVDTFAGNNDKVGVNVFPVRCACGQHEDVVLRWEGSMGDLLSAVLGSVVTL